ncbi:ribosome small subunit-dependent GTPase A [Mangrovimonas sp. AS39]|uniref:ribosome small subunit-dependent GTPase A n=1 Tax=Mangrovimonas futianensis TaxID=2895523 RepID=UPI001E51EA48|nr:ribosome small subunit-dependent GTPase A [Mangrovimonas futianensis]MCF1192097.1 ribosome small subunit-dependent GTPase A [Mangrovimonas futianensis]MCF1195791.1 ribosome small subunit-dependent GTPase A [Mangrovimonas futianensis]
MTLEELGYTLEFENYRKEQNLDSFGVGRVISEHKERYVVKTSDKEYDGEIIGNLRFTAQSRSDFPAVGDWVAISEYDENKVLIHSVFPRKTIIERQAVGKQGEKQIIATNIDYAFIVQAVDRDFNINRIERYLTICNTSNVKPIIILNKIDLIDESALSKLITTVQERIKQVPVFPISNASRQGFEKLIKRIERGSTYCLLGSSGVGKSTLLNSLLGKQLMKTNTISASTSKGRHITTHRELLVLENGGILIDNPGMREVGIADATDGLELTFEAIIALSKDCKFKDCTHTSEVGCAVLKAVESHDIDKSSYENFLKMEREKKHFESTVAEKRKKDKDFGKMIKNYKKRNKHNNI